MIYQVTFHISTLYIIKYHQLKNYHKKQEKLIHEIHFIHKKLDRIPSTNPGAEPPRDDRDSGSARSHSTHLEASSSEP